MTDTPNLNLSAEEVKSCCARLYEQDFVRMLLGDSFHPGGLKLTSELGQALRLTPESRVLDVAAGSGTSALHLASRFKCRVVGVDYGTANIRLASESAKNQGLSHLVQFEEGDSEALPFDEEAFDAVICECAFCTFPDKAAAAHEFHRVLKPGGGLALSDITRVQELPEELRSLMAWIACIADARPAVAYRDLLVAAGFEIDGITRRDEALSQMVHQIQMKLLGLEIAVGLKKLDLPDLDFANAKRLGNAAFQAIKKGDLGYAVLTGTRP